MGEQADYLRFMPEKKPGHARCAGGPRTLLGGPGWVVVGVAEDDGRRGAGVPRADVTWCRRNARSIPNQMYLAAWEYVFPALRHWRSRRPRGFVVAFAAQDQRHQRLCRLAGLEQLLLPPDAQPPGPRGVGGVQHRHCAGADGDERLLRRSGHVLGLYSNIAIAWMMAVVADLVINKPLGLSPAGHRVPAGAPVRHQPGRRRRDGHCLRA